MKQNTIRIASLDDSIAAEQCLMDQEIPGTRITRYRLLSGEKLIRTGANDLVRIWIVCAGSISISVGTETTSVSERGIYAADPRKEAALLASDDAEVIELCRYVSPQEYNELCAQNMLPYLVDYDKAPTYTEDCKSAKTVSRMLIPARIVPRFAMGSVQTKDDDLVEQHSHPMLEQYFFGLRDNSCELLIDDSVFPFAGNMLVHIPLGSNHGVRSNAGQVIHYLWMDFLFDEEGLLYMDREHKISTEEIGKTAEAD